MMKTYTVDQVAQHKTADDLWIIIKGNVYNMTPFLAKHPGGKNILLKHAGTDATKHFLNFHPDGILESIGAKLQIGTVGASSRASRASSASSASGGGDDVVEGEPFGDLVPYGDPNWYQGWTSPYYDASHLKLRAYMRAFVEKEISPYCSEWEEAKRVPRDLYIKAGKAGILACFGCMPACKDYLEVPLPTGLPVDQYNYFHEFVIIDEMSRCGSGGLLWSIVGGRCL